MECHNASLSSSTNDYAGSVKFPKYKWKLTQLLERPNVLSPRRKGQSE